MVTIMIAGLVSQAEIQAMVNRIAEHFVPEKILLFGSYVYGQPTPDSDIDFLVIMPEPDNPWRKRAEIICKARQDHSVGVDVILKSWEKAIKGYSLYNPIMRDALDKGVLLYER